MKVLLFTDTLFDVNGVSRFILNVADRALQEFGPPGTGGRGGCLHVATSTRFPCPPGLRGDHPTVHNIPPHAAMRMPAYEQLELVLPNGRSLRRLANSIRPDAVHVSTPGPVGMVGRRFALRRGLPLLGTYHTDFPAYIDYLLAEPPLTALTRLAMRRFYRPFHRIFTRSEDYAHALVSLGIDRSRIARLKPGIDTDLFHVRNRPRDARAAQEFWSGYDGVNPEAAKVLYVGRVSVEKNLPFLAAVWRRLGKSSHPPAQLIVVGDGPYRGRMAAELAGRGAVFLGFRHGGELSRLYAAADLFAFPSATDTLGQVVMEAQSSGVPVIVTDRGGPSEVVRSAPGADQTGLVLPADDAEAWAGAIRQLLGDPLRRRQMGDTAHQYMSTMSIRESFLDFWRVHEEEAARRATEQAVTERHARMETKRARHPCPGPSWAAD